MTAMARRTSPTRRKPVGIDEPGDCSCCSVEATPTNPVYLADVKDPLDGSHFARLCGSCYDEVETALAAQDELAAA